jgi:hypothetical protein
MPRWGTTEHEKGVEWEAGRYQRQEIGDTLVL